MPRRVVLSGHEKESLLALPESQDELIRYYTFNETDLALIRQRRGDANRLGFAVQLCLLRFPGCALTGEINVTDPVIYWVAGQIKADAVVWPKYAERDETRREHFQELRAYLGLSTFKLSDYRNSVQKLTELALQTDNSMVLATQGVEILRQRSVILPPLAVIERICAEAITRANRRIYRELNVPLTFSHQQRLDELLKTKPGSGITWLTWLRQSPLKPNSRSMLEHISRLKTFQALELPTTLGRNIHQNRLLKMAREGGQMTPKDLGKFEAERRYATLVILTLEGMATVTDEIIELHDRILIRLFRTAKHKHQQQFQAQGKAINEKIRQYVKIGHALLDAKESGRDAFAAIESVMPWDSFMQSVREADNLARPETFNHLHKLNEQFSTLRRYTPEFLTVLKLRAAPAAPAAQGILDGVDTIGQ